MRQGRWAISAFALSVMVGGLVATSPPWNEEEQRDPAADVAFRLTEAIPERTFEVLTERFPSGFDSGDQRWEWRFAFDATSVGAEATLEAWIERCWDDEPDDAHDEDEREDDDDEGDDDPGDEDDDEPGDDDPGDEDPGDDDPGDEDPGDDFAMAFRSQPLLLDLPSDLAVADLLHVRLNDAPACDDAGDCIRRFCLVVASSGPDVRVRLHASVDLRGIPSGQGSLQLIEVHP